MIGKELHTKLKNFNSKSMSGIQLRFLICIIIIVETTKMCCGYQAFDLNSFCRDIICKNQQVYLSVFILHEHKIDLSWFKNSDLHYRTSRREEWRGREGESTEERAKERERSKDCGMTFVSQSCARVTWPQVTLKNFEKKNKMKNKIKNYKKIQ